jgi:UDP-N-acetylmuramoylalanine--D-glutamate ligase
MHKPTLFGYGLTTRAIAKKLGGACDFFDDHVTQITQDSEGNTLYPSSFFDPQKSSLEVTTPSLPPKHPLITQAKNLMSEYDYFAPSMPFSVWITGTNGKTTTTQMLTHLLQSRGAVSGGNIGTPIAELDPNAPIWVLETSSYTLHHTQHATPNIFILLPITPDHLSWHGDMKGYTQAKLSPLKRMREGELALLPKGLPLPPTSAYVVEYDTPESLTQYFDIDSSKLHYKGAFLQDALLALAVMRVLFDEVNYELMNQFKRDRHRQEEIYDTKGRLWVNDSKATNLDATIQALYTYQERKIHLILGGDDKGVDLTPLFEVIQPLSIEIYAIGSNHARLLDLSSTYSINAHRSETLQNAVTQINTKLKRDEIALLSPAAASFDQFRSYIARGEAFVTAIKDL